MNSMRITKNLAIFGLAGTMMFAGAGVGFAGEKPSLHAADGLAAANAPVIGTPAPTHDVYATAEQQAQLQADIEALAEGDSLSIPGEQGAVLVTKTSSGLALSVAGASDNSVSTYASFCGVALATAIVGIGAGALGVLAAVTGGGTAVIAGFVLTGSQIGVLAGIAGSYAAVLGWVSHNIC